MRRCRSRLTYSLLEVWLFVSKELVVVNLGLLFDGADGSLLEVTRFKT